MNVTLFFVLRRILRVVVLHRTNHVHALHDAKKQKMEEYSEGNQKCLFGDDSGDFAVPRYRNRADVLIDDEIDKFRNIS